MENDDLDPVRLYVDRQLAELKLHVRKEDDKVRGSVLRGLSVITALLVILTGLGIWGALRGFVTQFVEAAVSDVVTPEVLNSVESSVASASAGAAAVDALAQQARVEWARLGAPPTPAEYVVHHGSTTKGATAWDTWEGYGLRLTVSTAAANCATTPLYVPVLEADGWHAFAGGVAAVYSASRTEFKLHITLSEPVLDQMGGSPNPAWANSQGWHVRWLALEPLPQPTPASVLEQ